MKGLLLTIDQNGMILEAHPLMRRYFRASGLVGRGLDEVVEEHPRLDIIRKVVNKLLNSGRESVFYRIALKPLNIVFANIALDTTLRLRIYKGSVAGKTHVFFFADNINDLEEYYSLFRQKEELLANSISVLKEISMTVLNEPSSKIAARKSIELVCNLFEANSAIIRLFKNNRSLEKYVAYGFEGSYISENLEVDPRMVPIYAQAIRDRRPVIDEDPVKALGHLYEKVTKYQPVDSIIALPIIANDKVSGILTLLFTDVNIKLLRESEDILGNVVNELNFLLEKGDYFLELLDTTEKLRNLNMSIVTALSDAIETRDPYTKGHSERVASYAVEIARNMGWDDYELERLRTAGVLHDIGKVGIPDAVLLKPGNLSKHEREIIKLHPEMSAAIVKEIESFSELIPWVRYHHENFDGTGYPYGLKGNDIPLGARVIAVADAFDAMTSDRPYRKGLPIARVKEIFREGAGSQWDPDIVNIAMDSLEVILEKTPSYFHIPEILDEFRQRIFNMNLMDGLYLYHYLHDEASSYIEQKKNFSIALISLKKSVSAFQLIDQKRALATLIDITKKYIHYPMLVSRYNYYDVLILAPDLNSEFVKKIINKILIEFFQLTNLVYSSHVLSYPEDGASFDLILNRLFTEQEEMSILN